MTCSAWSSIQMIYSHLHGEVQHTNDTLSLICMVIFYIRMKVLHTNNAAWQMISFVSFTMTLLHICIDLKPLLFSSKEGLG